MKNLKDVSDTTPPTLEPISNAAENEDLQIHIPGTKMVHLAHAAVNLPAMVRSVCLKLIASRAIRGPTIFLANEDILGVEALETGGV